MKTILTSAVLFCVVSCDVEFRNEKLSPQARTERDIKFICECLSQFRDDVGRFPTHEEGLVALLRDPRTAIGWRGPYLHARGKPDHIMVGDRFGTKYSYVILSSKEINIISAGGDRILGNEDDIKKVLAVP